MFPKISNKPSPLYVFVVLSLAAFLVLFTFWRRPKAEYLARVTVPATEMVGGSNASDVELMEASKELRSGLLSAENVLLSLRNAGMMEGEAEPEMLGIAGEIASRMRARYFNVDGQPYMKLSLLTQHPSVGIVLLDQMMADLQALAAKNDTTLASSTAIASRVRGASIPASSLVLLLFSSSLVGVFGLMLLEQSKEKSVLLSDEDVMATASLPVVADFASNIELPARTHRIAWRRRFGVAIRVAELAIAAAILLMVYNVATYELFSNLLVNDPLGAYSDALGRLLG